MDGFAGNRGSQAMKLSWDREQNWMNSKLLTVVLAMAEHMSIAVR